MDTNLLKEVQKITIIPRGDAGGYNLMTPKKETYNYKKSDLLAMIMSFMGGRAAEQIIYGKGEVSTGASNDIQRATNIARAMVTQYGMSELGPIAYESASGSQHLGLDRIDKQLTKAQDDGVDQTQIDKGHKLILEIRELLSKNQINDAKVVFVELRGLMENINYSIRIT